MASRYPKPYDRSIWPNFIENYERQVNEFVSQGCDFYFNLLFWRAMRCIPLAVFLRDTMPEFCRGYMGYLFRYFLDGEKVDGKDTITYKNSNGVKISIYTSEFDGSIKERELAKKIVSKAGGAHNGQDTFRYRGQISKNQVAFGENFGCTKLYNIGGAKRDRDDGGYTQAFKGYQYYMQACIEILNNGTCRQGPHSALRKLGINTQGWNRNWGAQQTLLQNMWMLYSPNNSGVYSIHFWPETVHMFIRGIQIMFTRGQVPWDNIKDDWNLTGGYHGSENHAAARWLIGRSINCFLNDYDRTNFLAAQANMNDEALLAACLRSTAIRDERLAKIPTTWIDFEYPEEFEQWWNEFGKCGRNTVIGGAVRRVRLATRQTVDAFLSGGYNELADVRFHQPSTQQNNQLIDLDDFTNDASRTLGKVKTITDKSGRAMSGHISEHRQTAIDDDDLYVHHLGGGDIGGGFKMSNMVTDDIGKLKHRLETIRALVAGDDGAPPIPDSSKTESRTTLKYSPRSAREGKAVEAAHTTITVKRVVHLCLLDHLTAEGPIEPRDDGNATTVQDQKTGRPWEWNNFRNFMFAREAYAGGPKQHKLQQYIVHNAIQEWNNSPFMFAALGDAHYFVDDADAPLEMAIQLGGQRYIWNYGIRKLEQVECLPPLDPPNDETFLQFWANMVFFALFGGLNPYKEYWLPSPVNESVRIYSLHHILWQNDVDDHPDPNDRTYSDWVDELDIRVPQNGTLKNTVLNNLGSYIAAYMDFMMNIQNDQGGRDIEDDAIFQNTTAGPQGQLTEDLVNDYFPKRQLVFDRVVDMIVPYMVNDNGQMIRKSSSKNMFDIPRRHWFHRKRPDEGIYGVLGAGLNPNTNPKSGGWFKQYWMRTFNGELATAKQFRTPGNGGNLAQKGDKIFDEIANVTPLRDNLRFNSTGKEYATLNTIMWPHYTNKTGGGIKDAADSLKFYKIQLRNVLNTDWVTPLDLMDNINRHIKHEPGQQLLPNLYEMGLFYQEWHVQTYMFRQVYLDGRDSTIGKNCWDGFRAQDKDLAKVVRRPCFLKFNNHARQYDRIHNREHVNVGLEPFLKDDNGHRTPFFHRGLESNMIGHCINSKQSATSIQRRMTIGFAEQIQRITGAFTNTLLPNTLPVVWGDHRANHLTITSIRTSILERSIGDNTFALHSEWWKTNLKQPAKMNCQPGVVMVRYPWPIEVGRLSRNKGTGLIFCGGQYRHAEMMIGGRCREPDQDDDIDNATWNMLPRLVSLNESAQQARPTVPYYSSWEQGGKPSPLVRTIMNYTDGAPPTMMGIANIVNQPPQGNTVIDDFIELKF